MNQKNMAYKAPEDKDEKLRKIEDLINGLKNLPQSV